MLFPEAGYHFEDFVETSGKIHSKEHLFDTFKSLMRNHCGFDGMNFSIRRDDEVPVHEWAFGIINTYTDDWQRFYREHHCINVDPVYKCAGSSYGPFRWRDLRRRLPLSLAQEHLLNLAADAGLHNGQGIPFCGPRTQIAGIALTTSTKSADHVTNLPLLFAFCNQFYLTYKRIVGKIEPRLPDMHGLSPQDLEVLRWVSEGKNNQEIADLLSTGVDAVRYHVRRIYEKFGVKDRVSAVLMGIRSGLIDP